MIDSDNKKILISHRGNIDGPNPERENYPDYILEALEKGYYVEIDIWVVDNNWYLGHDKPDFKIDTLDYIKNPKIYLHCKNKDAFRALYIFKYSTADYFWHQNDDYVLTGKGKIWVYPNKPLIKNSICVLPELGINGNINECYGICSDYIKNYE